MDNPASRLGALGTADAFSGASAGISVFSMDAAGGLTNVQNVGDNAAARLNGAISATVFTAGGQQYLAVGGQENGVTLFTIGNDGLLTFDQAITDTATTYMAAEAHVTSVVVGGATYLITSGYGDSGISAFQIDPFVNDAPVLGGPSQANITFTEGQGSVALMQGVTVSDPDGPANFAGGSVGLTVDGATGGLTIRSGSNFTLADGGGGTVFINFQDGDTSIGIGTITGVGSRNLQITDLTSEATPARINDLLDDFVYVDLSDAPTEGARTVTLTFNDGGNTGAGGALAATQTQTLTVTGVDDLPTGSVPGTVQSATEDTDFVFSAANGNAITVNEPDSPTTYIALIVNSGSLTLSQTTGLTFLVGANGSSTIVISGTPAAINDALNGLVYRGDLNFSGTDTLTFQTSTNGLNVVDQDQITINVAPDGQTDGDSGNNTLTGTPQPDFFDLSQGGDDDVSGLASDDGFYFGAAYTSADVVDGGDGFRDTIGLEGDYSGGVTLGSLVGVEIVALLPGSDIRFDGSAANFYNYVITANSGTVVSDNRLVIQGNTLRATESLTFSGSASSIDFFIYGGLGADNFTGGSGDDAFFFGEGRLNAGDTIDGGAGSMDQLGLQGNFAGANAIDFNNVGYTQLLTGIEFIVLLSASDNRFGASGGSVDYDLTMNESNLGLNQRMIISANSLKAGETLTFNGSFEGDGSFEIYSGAGDDIITGSQNGDEIWGGAGADLIEGHLGGDMLHGGFGNDIFSYSTLDDSTLADPDRILDFTSGDLIDLLIIAQTNGGSLTYIGDASPSGAGQVQVLQTGNQATVNVYIDDDAVADMRIDVTVADGHQLTISDFQGVDPPAPAALQQAFASDAFGLTTALLAGQADFDFSGLSSHGAAQLPVSAMFERDLIDTVRGNSTATDNGLAFAQHPDVDSWQVGDWGDFRPEPEPYAGIVATPDLLL